MIREFRLVIAIMLGAMISPGAIPADDAGKDAAVERVVRDFNAAIGARKLDAALALTSAGALNFNIQAAHGFTEGTNGALATDLATHWRSITPILYGTTRAFRREVTDTSTHVDGNLAVVWASIVTLTKPKDGSSPIRVSFKEAYQLRREAKGWRIVSVASSRTTR